MWNLEGMNVRGMYLDEFEVSGRVESSRVTYEGGIQHTVILDKPVVIFGLERDRALLDHHQIRRVADQRDLTV